ncbi:MAG: four helix bundle protein [Patescibacteria group bacterium]|jgi:four helix bundle protein
MNDYVKLGDLDLYKEAVELSRKAWKIFENFNWQDRKIIGDQFIRSSDSIGANIAEGYGRFHYKDRVRFYYNSRGSLLETKHWILLLYERKKMNKEEFNNFLNLLTSIHKQLNSYISSCLKSV